MAAVRNKFAYNDRVIIKTKNGQEVTGTVQKVSNMKPIVMVLGDDGQRYPAQLKDVQKIPGVGGLSLTNQPTSSIFTSKTAAPVNNRSPIRQNYSIINTQSQSQELGGSSFYEDYTRSNNISDDAFAKGQQIRFRYEGQPVNGEIQHVNHNRRKLVVNGENGKRMQVRFDDVVKIKTPGVMASSPGMSPPSTSALSMSEEEAPPPQPTYDVGQMVEVQTRRGVIVGRIQKIINDKVKIVDDSGDTYVQNVSDIKSTIQPTPRNEKNMAGKRSGSHSPSPYASARDTMNAKHRHPETVQNRMTHSRSNSHQPVVAIELSVRTPKKQNATPQVYEPPEAPAPTPAVPSMDTMRREIAQLQTEEEENYEIQTAGTPRAIETEGFLRRKHTDKGKRERELREKKRQEQREQLKKEYAKHKDKVIPPEDLEPFLRRAKERRNPVITMEPMFMKKSHVSSQQEHTQEHTESPFTANKKKVYHGPKASAIEPMFNKNAAKFTDGNVVKEYSPPAQDEEEAPYDTYDFFMSVPIETEPMFKNRKRKIERQRNANSKMKEKVAPSNKKRSAQDSKNSGRKRQILGMSVTSDKKSSSKPEPITKQPAKKKKSQRTILGVSVKSEKKPKPQNTNQKKGGRSILGQRVR